MTSSGAHVFLRIGKPMSQVLGPNVLHSNDVGQVLLYLQHEAQRRQYHIYRL